MKTIFHPSAKRGYFNHGWLKTYHSFSFANYFDPEKVNFGALRVLNDDVISPLKGFGLHPHDNMEIVTIPLSGKLKHTDSTGTIEIIEPNTVQTMSAGTGIFHSEHNADEHEELHLLQIWIMPQRHNIAPRYNEKTYNQEEAKNRWQYLVSPEIENTLHLNQNAFIARTFLNANNEINYEITNKHQGSYLFIVYGEVNVNNQILKAGDAIGIYDTDEFKINAIADSYLVNIEVPYITYQQK